MPTTLDERYELSKNIFFRPLDLRVVQLGETIRAYNPCELDEVLHAIPHCEDAYLAQWRIWLESEGFDHVGDDRWVWNEEKYLNDIESFLNWAIEETQGSDRTQDYAAYPAVIEVEGNLEGGSTIYVTTDDNEDAKRVRELLDVREETRSNGKVTFIAWGERR